MFRTFQVIVPILVIATSIEIVAGYDVTKLNLAFVECPVQKVGHSAERDLSFNSCVDNCARKPWCHELIYDRRSRVCYLCHESCPDQYQNKTGKGCVRVHKNSIRDDVTRKCDNDCGAWNEFRTCDPDRPGGCLLMECPNIFLWDGQLLGNMMSIGSRKKVNCIPPLYEVLGRSHVTCIDGYWPSPQPFCDGTVGLG